MLTRTVTTPHTVALAVILLAPLAVLFATIGPIPQDPAYHALADGRMLFAVPNFFNVATNAGFLVIGILGLHMLIKKHVPGASRSWALFFFGILLVGFGSAYYHLAPADATLVWDRLPMTIAFMALFSALVAEHVAPEAEGKMLPVAVVVGILSVAWWHYSNDLRLYAWVQFGPLAASVYMLIVYPARYPHRGYLAIGLVFYALAKVFEFADGGVFAATSGAISGHSLKHLVAALAPLCVYLMLRARS
jgi:hypothetical protein